MPTSRAAACLCAAAVLLSPSRSRAEDPPLPAPLACYERIHGLRAILRDGRYHLELPGGGSPAYDDGARRDLAARLARPDIEDQFVPPYSRGPVGALVERDHDPGRVRVEALLRALYPTGAGELLRVDFLGGRVRVHRRVAPALARVAERLRPLLAADAGLRSLFHPLGGGHAARRIAGTERPSPHAFGIAIDLNPRRTDYWRWNTCGGEEDFGPPRRSFPQAVVDAFEAEGFVWGGRWYHYDTMHFEFRPEIVDPACHPPQAAEPPERGDRAEPASPTGRDAATAPVAPAGSR